jgi:hypothetical protein
MLWKFWYFGKFYGSIGIFVAIQVYFSQFWFDDKTLPTVRPAIQRCLQPEPTISISRCGKPILLNC